MKTIDIVLRNLLKQTGTLPVNWQDPFANLAREYLAVIGVLREQGVEQLPWRIYREIQIGMFAMTLVLNGGLETVPNPESFRRSFIAAISEIRATMKLHEEARQRRLGLLQA